MLNNYEVKYMVVEQVVGTVAASTGLDPKSAAALAAGLAMGLSALAAAWSQGAVGSAAMGAVAERPELEGKLLIYLAIPELLAILGFIVAFFLISKL